MARITILGGTGHTGHHLVREAACRGHEVTSYSRHEPWEPVPRVNYKIASLADAAVRDEAVSQVDVVISALAPREEMHDRYEAVHTHLIDLAAQRRIRLGVIGDVRFPSPGPHKPHFVETDTAPAEVRIIRRLLETLLASAPQDLDWFFVSPAEPDDPDQVRSQDSDPGGSQRTFRIGSELGLPDGNSRLALSAADFADAVIDEVEDAKHHRTNWFVAH